jgi:hypothetical protein
MSYNTEKSSLEPFVVSPFVNFLDKLCEVEATDNPLALRNISEMGITLGINLLKENEGQEIRKLKKQRFEAEKKVFEHFAKVLKNEHKRNEDNELAILNQREYIKNEVGRIYDRYIIRICNSAFKRAPLKMVSVDSNFEPELFFKISDIMQDATEEKNRLFELYKIEA